MKSKSKPKKTVPTVQPFTVPEFPPDDGLVSIEGINSVNNTEVNLVYFPDGVTLSEMSRTDKVTGRLHYTGGPAVIRYCTDGTVHEMSWFTDGFMFNSENLVSSGADLPSYIRYYPGGKNRVECLMYTDEKGKLHRELPKPALIILDMEGNLEATELWVNGVESPVVDESNTNYITMSTIMKQCHSDVLEGLSELYDAKNADYGGSSDITYLMFGEVAQLIRLWDKLLRMTQLHLSGVSSVKTESFDDTLQDLVNYGVLAMAQRNMYSSSSTTGISTPEFLGDAFQEFLAQAISKKARGTANA